MMSKRAEIEMVDVRGPWTLETSPFDEHATVWGPDGDRVARVDSNLAFEEPASRRGRLIAQAPAMQEEIIRLRERIEALEATLELHINASERARDKWHEMGGDPNMWPDKTDNIIWLLDRLQNQQERIEALEEADQ